MTGAMTPAWADPTVHEPVAPGFRAVQDSQGDPLPFLFGRAEWPRRKRTTIAMVEGDPLFKLRAILGAWVMKLLPPTDPATRKLARYNREHPPLGRTLPPSHDISLHPRWDMPAVLPIRGVR